MRNEWSARVIQVIETHLTVRGSGTKADPMRTVRQYWALDGELLAEVDPTSLPHAIPWPSDLSEPPAPPDSRDPGSRR